MAKTLDEHTEAVVEVRRGVNRAIETGSAWALSSDATNDILRAYEAEHAARLAAEARVRELEAIVGNARSVCCSAAVRCGRCGADQRYEVGHG